MATCTAHCSINICFHVLYASPTFFAMIVCASQSMQPTPLPEPVGPIRQVVELLYANLTSSHSMSFIKPRK